MLDEMRLTDDAPSARQGAQAMTLRGRALRQRMPIRFAMEFSMLGSLLVLYLVLRFTMRGSIDSALDNAHHVVRFERAFGLLNEDNLQSLALHSHDLVRFLNSYYLLAHFTITSLFFAWMFIRRPEGYASCRRILIIMTAMGLVIHAVYPLAPPRMLPDLGFVDTGHLFGPSPYGDTSRGLANQFAAMPSLHFGWALLVAWGAARYGRTRWRRLLILHPIFTLAAIIITGNHYWVDALVALCLFLGARQLDQSLRRRSRRRSAIEPAEVTVDHELGVAAA